MQTDLIIIDSYPAFANGIWSFISNHKQISNNIIITDSFNINCKELVMKSDKMVLIYGIENIGSYYLETLVNLFKINPSVKVICTGNLFDLNSIEAIKNIGCFGYFPKSSNESIILNTLNGVLNNKKMFNIELDSQVNSRLNTILNITLEEKAILYHIANGLSTKQIAVKLNKSINTIDFKKNTLFKKSNTKNIGSLINFAHVNKIL